MNSKLALTLAASALLGSKRRSLLQLMTAAVVTGSLLAAAAIASTATRNIADAIDSSGALLFSLQAIGDDGSPDPFSEATTGAIDNLDQVTSVTQTAKVPRAVTTPARFSGDVDVRVLALSVSAWVEIVEQDELVKLGGLSNQGGAVLGHSAALRLGLTGECAVTGLCTIEIGTAHFPVIQIRVFEDPSMATSVLIRLDEAVALGLTAGPTQAFVGSRVLPVDDVALNIDKAVSTGGQRVFVTTPTGSDLRAGFAKVWSKTITAAVVGLMLLASMGQVAQNVATISERRREVATLRSLGVSPSTVVVQFVLELMAPSIAGSAVSLALFWITWILIDSGGSQWGVSLGSSVVLASSTGIAAISAAVFAAAKAASVAPSEVFDA